MLFYLKKSAKGWRFFQDTSLCHIAISNENDWIKLDSFNLHYITKNSGFVGRHGLGDNTTEKDPSIFNSERYLFQQLRKYLKNLHIHEPKKKINRSNTAWVFEIWEGEFITKDDPVEMFPKKI